MKHFIIYKRVLLLAFVANNLLYGLAFGQNYERINITSNTSVLTEYDAKSTFGKEKMHRSTQFLYKERAEKDTAALVAPKNLYFDVKILGGGGARSQESWFLDLDLFSVALGYGSVPLLFGFKLLEFQTLLPWGSQTTGTYSVGARYIWAQDGKNIQRYLFGEFNWGTYSREEELGIGGEPVKKEYGCWYFDLGLGAILQTRYFEVEVPTIGDVGFNGLEARLGWRIGHVEGEVDNPMLGIYASVKYRFGWSGVKRLK